MSPRAGVWTVGLALTAALAVPLTHDEGSRKLIGPVVLLALAVIAAIAELVAELRAARSNPTGRPYPAKFDDASPADGVVDLVALRGSEFDPNPWERRIGRFVRLDDEDERTACRSAPATSTPVLLGRVALISVFIGLDGRGWTDREIAEAHKALERAGIWIEREASRRGAPVNVVLPSTYLRTADDEVSPVAVEFLPEGDEFGPMEVGATAKYLTLASRAAARLGFSDAADLVARINRRLDADAHAWMLHLRRAGRSLAIPAIESDLTGVGLAVCFSREASFPEPLFGSVRVDPLTVVHEVLHLFGASDKYGLDLAAYPRGLVGPDDIMRMDHESLSRLRIGDLTATEIGWGGLPRSSRRKTPAGDG